MDTVEFLRLVVPEGDLLCLTRQWVINAEKTVSNHPVRTHDDLATAALKLNERKIDVWHALASYEKEAKYMKNEKNIRVYRKAKHVAFLKSLWLDIDFKKCSLEELKSKFAQFIKDTKLPVPSLIINSGGGWHVYWCLDEAIPPMVWAPLAEGLKQLCKDHNLPADHACTADPSRVLRPVNTYNYKYDPPRMVRLIAGTGAPYSCEKILSVIPKVDNEPLPAHLRNKAVDAGEYSQTGFVQRDIDTKKVMQNCGVLRHVLQTGGAECSEPMWNYTLLLLRFLPDGAKLVHPMSKGHIGYDASATNDKWRHKLEADVSGPPFCSRFQEEYGKEKCLDCSIYQSKKPKTPLTLGYVSDQDAENPTTELAAVPGTPAPVTVPSHEYPYNWRAVPGNKGVERKVMGKKGEWEWVQVLRRQWRLLQAQKSINTGEYAYFVEAKTITGKPIRFSIPGSAVYGCPKTWETLGLHGAILTSNEKPQWVNLMATWLQKLQEENAVLNTTDQLGWIERQDDQNNRKIVGFASGGTAFFSSGEKKQNAIAANPKHKGIASYYAPVGDIQKWQDVSDFLVRQGHMHVITMLASAFAGPLVKFTGQSGAIMSFVSTGTSAGKSLSLEAAAAVWGNPKLGTMTLNDTPTSVKNKIAYLQNITAYWDEVRGDERSLHNFIQTAFQVTQGKDRERANQSAKTIAAQTWHTMLVCTGNDSIFDLAASQTGASDAGVYRIFEISIKREDRPKHDTRIARMVADLQDNFGGAGDKYAEYLSKNSDKVRDLVIQCREKTEDHFGSEPAERFWVASVTSIIVGATIAKRLGLCNFEIPALWGYLSRSFTDLRKRVLGSASFNDPKELLVAYMMQYQAERLVVDVLRIGRGGVYKPIIIGNVGHIRRIVYQIGRDQNILRVVKQDFVHWLRRTRNLQFSGDLYHKFVNECQMIEHKSVLGAGTQFATSQARCLDFIIDSSLDGDENGDGNEDKNT